MPHRPCPSSSASRPSGSPRPAPDRRASTRSCCWARRWGWTGPGILAHPDAPVGADARQAFEAAVERRERGEPVAYIRGFREFHGLAFATDSRALIPRPETELLVDAALAEVTARLAATPRPHGAPALRVVDVGTGTGAIAISLLAALRRRKMDDQVLVIAVDVSAEALQLARENAVGHGVADRMVFVAADLLPYHVEPPYAVVCANLPYVPTRRAAAAVARDRVRADLRARRRRRTASTSCAA